MADQNKENIAAIIAEFNSVLSGFAASVPAAQPATAIPALPIRQQDPPSSLVPDTAIPGSLLRPAFRYAFFAPSGRGELSKIFTTHLLEIAQKTMKKEYMADLAICEEIDYTVHNEATLLDRCLSLKIPAVFMIGAPRRPEVRKGVLCRWLSEDEVLKRFLYVDIVLELVQLQKLKGEAAV